MILSRTSYERGPIDFLLCIGADSVDEEMYPKFKNVYGLTHDGLLADVKDNVTNSSNTFLI